MKPTFGVTVTATFLGIGEKMFEWRVVMHKDKREHSTVIKLGFGHCKRAKFASAKGAIQANTPELARVLKPTGKLVMADLEHWIVPTPPTVEDVLQLMQFDARSGEYELFEDFARDFDYDVDSREAERIWHACRESRGHMRKLLGPDFSAFLSAELDS